MSSTPKHVLVVEDNIALSTLLQFNLQRAGYQVTVAEDGDQAWQYLQQGPCDLIITDQQMPKMTGCQLCVRLRQDERFREVPVIMLTAKGLEMELPRLRHELGIAATFHKPFSPREVLRTVEGCLTAVS